MPICKEPQPEKPNLSTYVPTGSSIYLDKVLNNPALPTYVIKAAKILKTDMYLPAGDYFMQLDDVEVLELCAVVNSIITADFQEFTFLSKSGEMDLYYLTLLAMLLLRGEGIIEVHPNELPPALDGLFVLIAVEELYRSGKVEVFRENFTIAATGLEKPIARHILPKDNNEKPTGT